MTDAEIYQFMIHGHLDTHWAGWFDDLSILRTQAKEGAPVTILQGSIPDQAAIHGILGRIRNLNLKLISIIPIDSSIHFPEEEE